jgi:hypothetical protein
MYYFEGYTDCDFKHSYKSMRRKVKCSCRCVDGWSHSRCKFLHTSNGASETKSLHLSCFIDVFDVIMLLFVQSIPDCVSELGLGQSVLLLDFEFVVHCLVFGSRNLLRGES